MIFIAGKVKSSGFDHENRTRLKLAPFIRLSNDKKGGGKLTNQEQGSEPDVLAFSGVKIGKY